MNFQFGQGVLNLPAAVLSNCETDAVKLKVLLWLASDLSLAQKPKQLAKLADCTQKEASEALGYWSACGVLAEDGTAVPAMANLSDDLPVLTAAPAKKALLQRADELPNYSSAELTALMEKRAGVRTLVDEAQQILGKMFNPSELNILIGMLDYLGMTEECILLLMAHCRNIGKANMRSIEKIAYKMVDRGITEPEAMEEEIRTMEALHGFEGQVRDLFGMGRRSLTTRESKMLRTWVSFGYGIDIVRLAYERTINATNEPSMPYANSILERWNADGLHTAEEIERAEAEQKQKKEAKKDAKKGAAKDGTVLGNSFDTDDFFEAALRRSFSDSPKGT